jgi:hypothetical protein
MKRSRSLALVSAGLVAGLVLGSIGYAVAAPADAAPTSPVAAAGLHMGRSIRAAGGRMVDILASLTGLTTEQIATERAAGKSVATIAESKGVSSDAVVAKALEARKTIIDARVADGTLSRADADASLAQMKTRLEERVNTTEVGPPSWAGGGRGGAGGMGGRGMGDGSGTCVVAP